MEFNHEAFMGIFNRELALLGETPAVWARRNKISPGALHDVTAINKDTGKPRRTPGPVLLKKLADGLGVTVGAISKRPAAKAS